MVKSEDVARAAGVSRATVSLVLNGRTDIAIPDITRQRVHEAARTLGYRPHRSGRAMRSGKTGTLAFVLSTVAVRSLFTPRLLEGLLSGAAQHDHHLLVARLDDTQLDPKILREVVADGLILNYNSQLPPRLVERITDAKIPAIWINDKRDFDCVYPDDFQGAYDATRQLLAEGHTQIGYAGWNPGPHYSMTDRLGGYRAALAQYGLPERVALLETSSPEVLAGCTAVVCYTARVLELSWKHVPDAHFVCFDAYPYTSLERSFDTWILPDEELGLLAVELLLQKLAAPNVSLPARAVPLTLQRGAPPS